MTDSRKFFLKLLPFWLFVFFFKFGAGLHYEMIAPIGIGILAPWVVGALIAGASFLQLILDVPAGLLLDRHGYVRMLRLTTLIFALAAIFWWLQLSIASYILSVFIGGLGWLFFSPGISAYILSKTPTEIAGRSIATMDVFASLGIVAASLMLAFTVTASVLTTGVIVFCLIVAAFIMLTRTPYDTASVHAEQKIKTQHYHVRRHRVRDMLRAIRKLNPASGMLLVQGLAAAIFYGAVWFVVPITIASQKASIPSIGLGIFDFAVIVLGFLFGKLADKGNYRFLVLAGLLLFSVTGGLLGFSVSLWFILLGFLATSGEELSGLSLWAWLDRLDATHTEDGLIAGTITFFQDAGWTIGPLAAGLLYGVIGPSWTIAICAVPIFMVWIVSLFVVRGDFSSAGPITHRPHQRRHKG